MRIYIAASVLFFTAMARAMTPEYDSSRRWLEQKHPADKTPAASCVFVFHSTNTLILRFNKRMSLREIIDATPLKGKTVTVYILRETQERKPVFDQRVTPSATPTFAVRPHDLLFIHVADGVPRW